MVLFYRENDEKSDKTLVFMRGQGSDNSCFQDYLIYFPTYG